MIRKATAMRELDGEWNVRRVSGALPPLYGVRKRIDGLRGVTLPPLPVPLPFDVVGRELRRRALSRPYAGSLRDDASRQFSQGLRSCSISRQPRGLSSRARTRCSSTTTSVG